MEQTTFVIAGNYLQFNALIHEKAPFSFVRKSTSTYTTKDGKTYQYVRDLDQLRGRRGAVEFWGTACERKDYSEILLLSKTLAPPSFLP